MSLNAQARVLYGSPLSQPKFASFVIIIAGGVGLAQHVQPG